jgi:hypothetical protein
MAKKQSQRRLPRRSGSVTLSLPGIKIFRPWSWHDGPPHAATEYISHLLQEVGRLGLKISDIERHDRPPHTKTVLSDLLHWLNGDLDPAFANLINWRHLDVAQMSERVNRNPKAKPRIEISATITKMNNLSVCWHPGGWRDSRIDWRNAGEHRNLIERRTWEEPPDFWWFVGDEEPTFQGRATNELMYVRGVGSLDPEPREQYGPYATFNADVVDSILICAVRGAYECLVTRLEESFDVMAMDAFDFVTRDERRENNPRLNDWPTKRVIAWSLEDAAQLRIRRQRTEQAEEERRERHALETVTATYGCSIETLIEMLVQIYSSRSRGRAVAHESANRDAAKSLRAIGAKIDAGDVRRIRELIERYRPDILPATLREQSASPVPEEPGRAVSNVVVLTSRRSPELRAPAEDTSTARSRIAHPVKLVRVPTTKVDAPETAEQEARQARELDRVLATFGCTFEAVVDALTRAYAQPPEVDKADEDANREAAKELRLSGARVDTEGVRRLRRLIELCKPGMLPELLRPKTAQLDPGK